MDLLQWKVKAGTTKLVELAVTYLLMKVDHFGKIGEKWLLHLVVEHC